MGTFTEEGVLEQELSIIADETMKRHVLWEKVGGDRSMFFHAQIAMCCLMMELIVEHEDVSEADFVEACRGSLEMQYPLYKKARVENNRQWMIITLARIRLTKTLLRRLQNPQRRALLHEVDGAVIH